jgi:DNA-3-methyladenine glycosylase
MGVRLDRSFYQVPAEALASRLMGMLLVRVQDDGTRLSGLVVETEAYCGVTDLGSHAVRGRRTQRNEAMYGAAGLSYVYFTYGMHFCMNVVCGDVDEPVAVLLRGLEPVEGIERMHELRGLLGGKRRKDTDLCSGPAKICQAMAIDRSMNAVDMVTSDVLFMERPEVVRKGRLIRTARIGLNNAGDWTYKPLRWVMQGNPHVSPGRPPKPPA